MKQPFRQEDTTEWLKEWWGKDHPDAKPAYPDKKRKPTKAKPTKAKRKK